MSKQYFMILAFFPSLWRCINIRNFSEWNIVCAISTTNRNEPQTSLRQCPRKNYRLGKETVRRKFICLRFWRWLKLVISDAIEGKQIESPLLMTIECAHIESRWKIATSLRDCSKIKHHQYLKCHTRKRSIIKLEMFRSNRAKCEKWSFPHFAASDEKFFLTFVRNSRCFSYWCETRRKFMDVPRIIMNEAWIVLITKWSLEGGLELKL